MTDPQPPDEVPVPPPASPYQPPVSPPGSPYQPPGSPYQSPGSPYQPPVPPPPVSPYYAAGPQKPPTVLSLLAMIFGIIGIAVSCCYGAGFLFSLAGVILGHLALKRESARGMALAGLITGYVGLGVVLIWIVVAVGVALFAVSTRF